MPAARSSPPAAMCPACDYPWTGLPARGACPECGYAYDEATFVVADVSHVSLVRSVAIGLLIAGVMFFAGGMSEIGVALVVAGGLAGAAFVFLLRRPPPRMVIAPRGLGYRPRLGAMEWTPWATVDHLFIRRARTGTFSITAVTPGHPAGWTDLSIRAANTYATRRAIVTMWRARRAARNVPPRTARTPVARAAPRPMSVETCPACDYPWTGLHTRGACPECGFAYEETTRIITDDGGRPVLVVSLLVVVLHGILALALGVSCAACLTIVIGTAIGLSLGVTVALPPKRIAVSARGLGLRTGKDRFHLVGWGEPIHLLTAPLPGRRRRIVITWPNDTAEGGDMRLTAPNTIATRRAIVAIYRYRRAAAANRPASES